MARNAPRLALAAIALSALGCGCSLSGLLSGLHGRTEEAAPATPTLVGLGTASEWAERDDLLVNLYERTVPGVVFIRVLAEDGDAYLTVGTGSGFVIDTDGHIVTNAHVVADADGLQVTFFDGSVAKAEVLAADLYSDLAVIGVDVAPELLVPLQLGDSASLRVGQSVVALGNPMGLEGTMTLGVVSALDRGLPATEIESGRFQNPDIIQTDAAIYLGSSGGPLLDMRGEVVGVTTAIAAGSGFAIGMAFAVPVDTVKRVVPGLISEGEYPYPYLGIGAVTSLSMAEMAELLDLVVDSGVLVADVYPDTGAEQAGLQGGDREVVLLGVRVTAGGDIITAIDDHQLRDFDDLVLWLVRETRVGQTVILTVIRDGEELSIPVVLGERP
jgi:S1-C subfamily serine protease